MTFLVERLAELRRHLDIAHDYVGLDLERVVEALDRLQPVRRFFDLVRELEGS